MIKNAVKSVEASTPMADRSLYENIHAWRFTQFAKVKSEHTALAIRTDLMASCAVAAVFEATIKTDGRFISNQLVTFLWKGSSATICPRQLCKAAWTAAIAHYTSWLSRPLIYECAVNYRPVVYMGHGFEL